MLFRSQDFLDEIDLDERPKSVEIRIHFLARAIYGKKVVTNIVWQGNAVPSFESCNLARAYSVTKGNVALSPVFDNPIPETCIFHDDATSCACFSTFLPISHVL